jgi:hypothetical protein
MAASREIRIPSDIEEFTFHTIYSFPHQFLHQLTFTIHVRYHYLILPQHLESSSPQIRSSSSL